MIARILNVLKAQKQRVTYVIVSFVLLTILKFGHSTHWSFGLGAHAAEVTSPKTSPATVVTEAPPLENVAENNPEIRLADQVADQVGIRVEPVTRRKIRHTLTVNGETDYDQDRVAQLSVRVPGHVWKVQKKVGETIRQGDCLAIIDAVEVGEAKTEFLQALVNFELKAKTLERLKRVSNEVAERSLRIAEAEERESRLRMLSAQQKLINLGLPIKLEDMQKCSDDELAARIRTIGLPSEIVAMLDPQTTTANLIPLTAPFDGVVIGRAATVGEMVSPASTQFIVADIERMWITLEVRKEHAGLVRLGQQIDFLADGASASVVGTIDWISTELNEATRTLTVRASVPNPVLEEGAGAGSRRLLKAHTFGIGRVVLRESPHAVAVPTPSVQFDGKRHFVFVRTPSGYARRDVRLGSAEDGFTEIQDGLIDGDAVVSGGSHVLKAELLMIAAQ
ncbi:MAG: efflux RND transporter periplasmic adaptor subunit [Pirellulales bacterium]